jgi:ABC-type Fe3+ transport system permease subunit
VIGWTATPAFAVALAHTLFNAMLAAFFMVVCGLMRTRLEARFGSTRA